MNPNQTSHRSSGQDPVETVRRFNRTVTRTIGVFGRSYLGRPRPLAASRLLYEIGADGAEVRTLRRRLGLDSGYLSRLLRSLERESLLRLTADPHDRRVRRAVLSESGCTEVRLLDRLSDDAAAALLHGVPARRRERLLEAMQTVERLLTSRAIELEHVGPDDPRAHAALDAYFEELARRFEKGFDPGSGADGSEFAPPTGLLLLATLYGEPVGCGAVRFYSEFAEIKRMWVDPNFRGTGTGSRILSALEAEAASRGFQSIRLDTHRSLEEARSLYTRTGYRLIPRYNENPYAQEWYEKRLGGT